MPNIASFREKSISQITSRVWFVMTALALTGQIAWAVENSWFTLGAFHFS